MKIIYTGSLNALPSKQRDKFETKLGKLSKMIERKGEREAHVIVTKERFLSRVEITMNAFDHSMVGAGSNGDVNTAMHDALEKLEKQVIRLRAKWRDTRRHKDKEALVSAVPAPSAQPKVRRKSPERAAKKAGERKSPRVFRVNPQDGHKPMTLEEAMLEVAPSQDYLVYHDAQTDRLSVLLRRADGHFDLIES